MYSWYRQGYITGTLGSQEYKVARKFLNNARWEDNEVVLGSRYPIDEDNCTTRYVEGRFNVVNCPLDVHILSHLLINCPEFRDLRHTLVNPMYPTSWWLKPIRLVDFAAWNSKQAQPYHSDYGPFDIQVLLYFTDDIQARVMKDQPTGGELIVGVKDQNGEIEQVYEHIPNDGTFVMLQPNNPYFQHKVLPSSGTRQVIELRYKIDG